MKTVLLTWTLTLLTLTACGSNGDTNTPADPGPDAKPPAPTPISNAGPIPAQTSLSCPSGTLLTYENFGEGFMLNYCTSCHSSHLTGSDRGGAPVGADFDTAIAVSVWRAAIADKALGDTPKMPPSGNVPGVDKASLTVWLNCGAPNAGGKSRLP